MQQLNAKPGTASGLYYMWDEKNQVTDVAAALPVASGTKEDNSMMEIVQVPASKAVYVNYYGGYDKLKDAYAFIEEYIRKNDLKKKQPMIEQYITDPALERDSTKWLTKVIYLVE
jgi:effector-binding domain-containing protein